MSDEKETNDSGWADLRSSVGMALVIFSFFSGIGSCMYLGDSGYAKRIEAEAKAKAMERSEKR